MIHESYSCIHETVTRSRKVSLSFAVYLTFSSFPYFSPSFFTIETKISIITYTNIYTAMDIYTHKRTHTLFKDKYSIRLCRHLNTNDTHIHKYFWLINQYKNTSSHTYTILSSGNTKPNNTSIHLKLSYQISH